MLFTLTLRLVNAGYIETEVDNVGYIDTEVVNVGYIETDWLMFVTMCSS
jgi:hypothetical protein